MRKTSKFLLLLASLGMLAACTPASGGGSGGDTPGGDTPGGDPPAVVLRRGVVVVHVGAALGLIVVEVPAHAAVVEVPVHHGAAVLLLRVVAADGLALELRQQVLPELLRLA